MSLDRQVLLACIADRKAYERVKDHINPKDFTPPVKFWWALLVEYYRRDSGCGSADRGVLGEQGKQRLANSKHQDTIMGVIADSGDVSSSNVVSTVLGLRRFNSAAEFAAAAMAGDSDAARKLLVEVNELWETDSLGAADGWTEAPDVDTILDEIGSDKRIKVLPVALNERIGGGVLGGHNILIFGRTEVGKSTFAINMAAGLVRKGKRVLYVSNEDAGKALRGRFICRITGKTWQEFEANPAEIGSIYKERTGGRLKLVHMEPGTISSVEKAVDHFKPDMVFVDQIRNLASAEKDLTPRLEANATRFRNLIARHGIVGVGIAQARNASERHNAEPPVWLDTGDIADSRVGLPSQMDLIIGIGGNSDMLRRGQRSISLCKNKLASDERSREGFIVQVDLARSGVR